MQNTNFSYDFFKKSADYILAKTEIRPEIAIVLGSCLGNLADEIQNPTVIDYKDIPNFLTTTVSSHAGKLIFGTLAGREVVCMSGRFHYYEGYDFEQLVTPVRVMKLLGVKTLLLTNASGGVNESFAPGDIMLICDHIKLMGASPLRGPNIAEFGQRFFDISDMYTKKLRDIALKAAQTTGIDLKQGTYFYATGPQFETPAEIRAMRLLGADAVGMSTVTEALTAAHCGMQVLGLSLIANLAAGMVANRPVTGEEVDETALKTAANFKKLVSEIVRTVL
ncbi:MAG: purine-nucleoside phosphorylase [Christensenella sp.]